MSYCLDSQQKLLEKKACGVSLLISGALGFVNKPIPYWPGKQAPHHDFIGGGMSLCCLGLKLVTIIIKSTQHLLFLLLPLGLPHISETQKCELPPVFLQRGTVRCKAIMYVPDHCFNVTGCLSVCMPFRGAKTSWANTESAPSSSWE